VQRHVEGADRDLGVIGPQALDVAEGGGQGLGQVHAPGLQSDHHQLVEAVVAFEDLVGHPTQRPLDVLGVHHPPLDVLGVHHP